jgi:hypothetical protein
MITSQRAFREFDPSERLYCNIAVGILGAGVLGAGATIFGASKAADAQTQAANASIANQQQMYAQNKGELQPFINAGTGQIGNQQALLDPNNASGPLAALMRLTTPGADQSAALAQTPGYQFALGQGLRASNNQLAARGLGGSGGAVAKGASQFATGLAGQTWQSVVQALQNQFQTQAGAGQNLINSGMQAGSSLAGVGTQAANAISGSQIGAGSAQAAGYNAIGTGISNNAYPSGVALAQLLGGQGGGGAAYGGNGVYGGSSVNPLQGLNASDYGIGY